MALARKNMDSSYNSPTTKLIYKGTQIIWYLLGLIETLLIFRFLFKLFAANPTAEFTYFIYQVTYPLVAPFLSVFSITQLQGNVFEWPTLLAMLVYWLVVIAIIELLFMSRTVSTPEAAERLNKKEDK